MFGGGGNLIYENDGLLYKGMNLMSMVKVHFIKIFV